MSTTTVEAGDITDTLFWLSVRWVVTDQVPSVKVESVHPDVVGDAT